MDALPARPVFSDNSLDAAEPPRPFRVSGLVSLLFGLISVGVLATTHLLFLPILAILFALFAFRPARDPNVVPAGRTLAVMGATLALLFAGWGVAQRTVQSRYMAADGERFAKNWLAVLEAGQRELAFELSLPPSDRQLESMSLAKFYQTDPMALERFQSFAEQEPVKAILKAEAPLEWDRVDAFGPTRVQNSEMITLQFRDRSGQIDRPLNVGLFRTEPPPIEPPPVDDAGLDDTALEAESAEDAAAAAPVQWHVFKIEFVD